MEHPSFPRSARALVVSALASACVVPEPVGGAEGSTTTTPTTIATDDSTAGSTVSPSTADTSATDTSATSATDTSATDTSTTDTGPPSACPGVPEFQCTMPLECFLQGCGEPFSPFDAEGCMLPPCTSDDECEPDFACLRPQEYGGCAGSGLSCSDGPDGACQCISKPDCSGGWCVPADEIPPLECFGLPDAEACLDAGCTVLDTVIVIAEDCTCTLDVPACLLFPGMMSGGTATDYFWHEATGTVAAFGTSWALLPTGWRRCTDPGAPPACECYEAFMEPVCP
jgi:hypothetical protein